MSDEDEYSGRSSRVVSLVVVLVLGVGLLTLIAGLMGHVQ